MTWPPNGLSSEYIESVHKAAKKWAGMPGEYAKHESAWSAWVGSAYQETWILSRDSMLRQLPVSVLRDVSRGLKVGALADAGYRNLYAVVGLQPEQLLALPGIGPKTAPPLARAIAVAFNAVTEMTAPVVSTDSESLTLITAIFYVRRLQKFKTSHGALMDFGTTIKPAIRNAKPIFSPMMWSMTGAAGKSRALQVYDYLDTTLRRQDVHTLFRAWQALESQPSVEQLHADFTSNQRAYTELLETIVPGSSYRASTRARENAPEPNSTPQARQRQVAARRRPAKQAKQVRPGREASRGERIGGFTIVKKLGSGGFGTTYLAQNDDGIELVLKLPNASATQSGAVLETLEREVEHGRTLQSHYFARILDHNLRSHDPWIAQQYISGHSLGHVLDDVEQFPDHRVRLLIQQLAAGLVDLERHAVVHHDLKPDNIQLGHNDSLTVLDLGLGWRGGDAVLGGTLMYLPPEYFHGHYAPSPATDMWATAMILGEALLGEHPVSWTARHTGSSRPAVLESGKLSWSGVPAKWRGFLETMASPSPKTRTSSADLLRWLDSGSGAANRNLEETWIRGLAAILRVFPAPSG